MNPQVRINAMVSYFFLGWLMLFSKKPEWNDPFIRMHAKNATKIHLLAIVIFTAYSLIVKDFVMFSLPFLRISLHTLLITIFFIVFLGVLIFDAYSAYHGKDAKETFSFGGKSTSLERENIESLGELEKMVILGSFLPFFGVIITHRYPNKYTEKGLLVGGVFTFLIALTMLSPANGSNTPLILSFLYIACIVAEGTWMFVQSRFLDVPFLNKIPSIERMGMIFRAGVRYGFSFFPIIFGKEKNLSFQTFLDIEITREKPVTEPLFAPAWLIGIPFVNLMFLPLILGGRAGVWRDAILQGFVLDGVILFLWVWRGFSTGWTLMILFPIFRIFAMIPSDPGARIPVIYEIFLVIETLSHGILRKKETLKSRQDSVSFHYTEGDKNTPRT